jgi:SAM-dependent methyltransferase
VGGAADIGVTSDVARLTVAGVALFREFSDPRLAVVYDALGPERADTDFYLALAAELTARSVIDLGCGTGLLACELAQRGHSVIGVDPAAAMLDVARGRPGGELVRWVEGDAARLGAHTADLVTMTGHVAQVITDDESWQATLAATHEALRPGGRVAFESRDPDARAWQAWTRQDSLRTADGGASGVFEWWYELTEVIGGGARVRSEVHYRFLSSGEELVSRNELRFRTRAELTAGLTRAGFAVQRVYGDWDRRPAGPGNPEMIVIAARD